MERIEVITGVQRRRRYSAQEKALMRAAALQHTNLTEFVIRNVVVSEARKIIDENERLELTERDSLRVLDLLDNPPSPNDKLMAAAFALPKKS